jgi:hypothetical protein
MGVQTLFDASGPDDVAPPLTGGYVFVMLL